MKAIVLLFILTLNFPFASQKEEYVCMPCGGECDSKIYSQPGTCNTCGMKLVAKSTIKFKNISTEELCKRLKENPKVVLLDVRSPGEFNGTSKEVPTFGHFKNAININVRELESRIGELSKYKNNEVIVYCSHSHRSPQASYLLGEQGFTNVKNMAGGVSTLNPPYA
jgi:rhodanese-related sulfurtransferase